MKDPVPFLPHINKVCKHLCHNKPEEIEDLVQDTVLAVLEMSTEPDERVKSWFFRIAKNIHVNKIRRRVIQSDHRKYYPAEEGYFSDPDEAILLKEVTELLKTETPEQLGWRIGKGKFKPLDKNPLRKNGNIRRKYRDNRDHYEVRGPARDGSPFIGGAPTLWKAEQMLKKYNEQVSG